MNSTKKIHNTNLNIDQTPLVSICCLTYNHEKFIQKTLDSFLMQKTNFLFEIVIHDDASTDSTANIIREYTKKHPLIINPLLQKKNQRSIYRSGMHPRFNYPRIKGKYISICDGDDYWTDPLKLQKQVDFLENNNDFNICFTRSDLLKNSTLEEHKIPELNSDGTYIFDNLLEHQNFIATSSVMVRKNFNNYPDWAFKMPFGDLGLYLLTCKTAKIKCLNSKTTVYRIHKKGIWSGISDIHKYEKLLQLFQSIYSQLTSKQKKIVRKKHKLFIKRISYLKYKKNRLLRVLNRIMLGLKYKL